MRENSFNISYSLFIKIFISISVLLCLSFIPISILLIKDMITIIVSVVIFIFMFVFDCYLLTYKIEVFKEKFIYLLFNKKKEYLYKDICIMSFGNSIIIETLDGKENFRVSCLLKNSEKLWKNYNLFYKTNKLEKPTKKYNKIKMNNYKYFIIFVFPILGAIILILGMLCLKDVYNNPSNYINWEVNPIVLAWCYNTLGIIGILVGIYFLIFSINYMVEIADNKLIHRNFFRKTKEYNLNELVVKSNYNKVKFYKDNKKVLTILVFAIDNILLLDEYLYDSED